MDVKDRERKHSTFFSFVCDLRLSEYFSLRRDNFAEAVVDVDAGGEFIFAFKGNVGDAVLNGVEGDGEGICEDLYGERGD